MSGYRIDGQVLRDVSTALDRGGASVTEGGRALASASATGLGTDELDAAAGDLLAGWSSVLADVGNAVDDTTTGVRNCLADYTEAEQRITDLFRDGDR